MQIAVFSDTHSEFSPWIVPELPDVDVVVIAGDLGSKPKHYDDTLAFMRAKNPSIEIVTVLGNHEFYAGPAINDRGVYHIIAKSHNAVLLDNSEATIKGYTFVGGTLWTDVASKFNTIEARSMLNDYNHISFKVAEHSRDLLVDDVSREHKHTREAIQRVFSRPEARGKTIVVTHHAPSYQSRMPSRYAGSPRYADDHRIDDFYCNDYDDAMEIYKPLAWFHGHTHYSHDYVVGETRVICNPRGYEPNNPNPKFIKLGARFEVPDLV